MALKGADNMNMNNTKNKRHRILLYGLWGFIFFLSSLALPLYADNKSGYSGKAGEVKAPDFVLKDLKGRQFKLSDYKGKPVLIIFTATWCPYCRSEIPHLKDIYAAHGKQGLVMVNIDIQESLEKVSSFASKYQVPFRTLLDKTGDVADIYGVRGVPTMVLINREGNIVCWQCRSIDTVLEKLFGKK
jgi:peroxiredoxin